MINIKNASRTLTKVEEYLMTISPAITSIKDVPDDTKITVDATLEFEDVKEETGEVVEILSIITPDKEVYSCQSATFKRNLADIRAIMGDNPFTIIKVSGQTKSGRPYINCILDVDSIKE